ncbi:hypothetical protein H2204_005300 [Knufia peltigerae]|uniref:Uncharacterized protein n=1 Tax=Knufia peltigerae TaxID=1002370 RepID=A0AA38Y5N6_9EURO|nr:hypothetical protein H2204_005300 [Knufia peltigerae]
MRDLLHLRKSVALPSTDRALVAELGGYQQPFCEITGDCVQDLKLNPSLDSIYEAHISRFNTIVDGPSTVFHANLTPNSLSDFPHDKGVATEIFIQYFPADYSDSDMFTVENAIKPIARLFEQTRRSGACMSTSGWILEDLLTPEGAPEAGQKAKAFLAFMAWDSVEAHLRFQNTETFRACIPQFANVKGLRHSDLVYVHCETL